MRHVIHKCVSAQPATWQSRIPTYFSTDGQDEQSEQDGEDEFEERSRRIDRPSSESSFGAGDDHHDEGNLPLPPNNTAESSNSVQVDQILDNTCNALKQELETIGEARNSHGYNTYIKDFFARIFEDILHLVTEKRARELKEDRKTRLATQKQKYRTQVETLQSLLEVKVRELKAAQDELSVLETTKKSLAIQVAEDQNRIQAQLNKMRYEGEQEGRRRAIEDCNTIMESDLSALRRSHLEQISKMRAESYKTGFDAGRAAVSPPAATPSATEKPGDVSANMEAMESTHGAARSLVLEEGRRQGREMAYRELGLYSGDQVDVGAQSSDDLNKHLKVSSKHMIFSTSNKCRLENSR